MTAPGDVSYAIYLDTLIALVARIKERDVEIRAAAGLIADALAVDGLVHTFGTGHSHLLAEDAFFRAGGLAAVNPIRDARLMMLEGALASTAAEREPGLARAVLAGHEVHPGDAAIIASSSGRNVVPIEMAIAMRERGAKVIAITSVSQARASASRHPTGRHLHDVADVVLDTRVPAGDALVDVPGLPLPLGPASTVVGAAILHATLVAAAALATARGQTVAILRSANLDGGDEVLARTLDPYSARVPALRGSAAAPPTAARGKACE